MFGLANYIMIALFVLVAVGLPTPPAWAQDAKQSKPLFSVDGFDYQFIPRGRIHMNVCQQTSCVPGSRVSYTLYAPEPNPSFEQYKLSQDRVATQLRARAPQGTKFVFGTPEQTRDDVFTTFTNTREIHNPNGTKMFTKSTLLHAEAATISLVSSSEDKEAVETNRALFMLQLMILTELANKQN